MKKLNLKVGDTVFSIKRGWIDIIDVSRNSSYCYITSDDSTYDEFGRYHMSDSYPSIFIENPFKKSKSSKHEFPKWMNVKKDKLSETAQRFVLCKHGDFYITMDRELDNHDQFHYISHYKYTEDIPDKQPEIELTLEQIAEKFNVDVNLIKIKK